MTEILSFNQLLINYAGIDCKNLLHLFRIFGNEYQFIISQRLLVMEGSILNKA